MNSESAGEWPDAGTDAVRDQKLFEAKVDVAAGQRKSSLEHSQQLSRAVHDASIADAGASRDASIAQAKADHDASIARAKAEHDASIAETKATSDTHNAWATANRAADIANLQKFHETLSALATGSVDRARAGAELVQKAAAAVATLYTGILGLVFSVTSDPLPARGVLTPLFLGLAVVLSTAYLAYLGPARGVTLGAEPVTAFEPKAYQRLDLLIRVSSKIATRRSGFLRASVVSLGVGLAYIVLPFVSWPSSTSATSQTLPTAPDWPTPAAGIPDALNAIRYEAEVAEIAATRAAAAVPDPESELPTLLGGAAAGLAVVVLVPMLFRPEADTARRRPDTPDPLAATADAT